MTKKLIADQYVPILLIGYNRPFETSRIIKELENLPSRTIYVSLDGPRLDSKESSRAVYDILKRWSKESNHNIFIRQQKFNVGLYEHFRLALTWFFSEFKYGIVFEDDMEFRREFVEFIDSSIGKNYLEKYWSISGHNPNMRSDFSRISAFDDIYFFESNIHTIWGWAASSSSVEFFLNFIRQYRSETIYLTSILGKFTREFTNDPFLRHAIYATWKGKIHRASRSINPNWDNYWVLAAWAANKKSILPSYSLSRENPDFRGQQTHTHKTSGTIWHKNKSVRVCNSVAPYKKGREIKNLRVWGITRFSAYKQAIRRIVSRRQFRLRLSL